MKEIHYNLITNVEDLYAIGKLVKKGIIKMPNITQLSKQLGCSRDKTRNVLNGVKPKKTRNKQKYLDEFKDYIEMLLDDKDKEFDYIDHLYKYVKEKKHITCCYSTFRAYIRNNQILNNKFKKSNSSNRFTERFETKPGEQAQFDLKEDITLIKSDKTKVKVHIATLTMGYSRYNVRIPLLDKSYESVTNFLAMAFEIIGGVPKQLVIDNIKCLIDTPRTKETNAIINVKFIEFAKDYGFEIYPCMPYRPQTKGKTESQNKLPSRLKNYNGEYNSLHDICIKTKKINDEDNESISQATSLPPNFLLRVEKKALLKLPSQSIRENHFLKHKEVCVSNESLFTFKSCKYSVPKEFIGKKVGLVEYNNKLQVYYNNYLIATHEISKNKINILQSHNLKYEKNIITINPKESDVRSTKDIMGLYGGIVYDNI